MLQFLILFTASFVIASIFTPIARKLAFKLDCLDVPRPPRNLHATTVAKLGGLAVFGAIALIGFLYVQFGGYDSGVIPLKFLVATLLGMAVLVAGGAIDDKYDLPPKILWLFPAIASIIVIKSGIGIGITSITNPFGGSINLNFEFLTVPASVWLIFLWMNGMMYTTKFLDGLDGLVPGIGIIAGMSLFALSLTGSVNQPITASLAIIFVGALAGYFVYAFHPSVIFLGEGGSTLVGFVLAVLSVILGGKIATALLVMGIPILDVAWVILQRLWQRKSPFVGDRLHIHFRLLDLGFSQRQTVFILYAISAVFGFVAVFLQTEGKAVALGLLILVMIIVVALLVRAYKKKQLKS